MSATPHQPAMTGAAAPRRQPSAADGAARATPLGETATIQQYSQTLLWTFASIGVCALAYAVEKYIFRDALGLIHDSTYRMFKNPAELPMRLFGLPHFIVGLLFMLSSRRMRGARSWVVFAALLALGAGFSWLFYRFGRAGDGFNALALMLFYFYFLIHGLRDEAFFYKAHGDMPEDAGPTHDRVMVVLQALLLGLLLSLAIPAYVLYGEWKPEFSHPLLQNLFPAQWSYATRVAATFLPMAAVAWVVMWRIARVFPEGLRGLWETHKPILVVFLCSTGIVLLALVSGPWTFNAVVLMHFVGWYIFGRRMLARRPPPEPPRAGGWKWMRTTPLGFTWLHLGLTGVVIALVALSTYGFGKTDALELIVGSKSFYYWTIIHVTLSFYPR